MKKQEILQYIYDNTLSGEYENETFLIVDSWEFIKEVEKLARREFDKALQWLFKSDSYVEWGFSDEYTLCSECSNTVIRTSPDSYNWTADYYLGNGFIACHDCAQDCLEEAINEIQSRIENNLQPKSLPDCFTLGEEWQSIPFIDSYGYESKWVNGLYGGQRDDPLRQGKIIHAYKEDKTRLFDVCFIIFPSQFEIEWDTYIRVNPDIEDGKITITDDFLNHLSEEFQSKAKFPYDPARLMEEALKQAANFTKIDYDCNTGEIKNQDFNSVTDMYPNLK